MIFLYIVHIIFVFFNIIYNADLLAYKYYGTFCGKNSVQENRKQHKNKESWVHFAQGESKTETLFGVFWVNPAGMRNLKSSLVLIK